MPLEDLNHVVTAKAAAHLPAVFTQEEAQHGIDKLSGTYQLMAQLLYGSGLRLTACIRLRIKDIDYARHQITVRDGKGMEDRVTMLSMSIGESLRAHAEAVHALHTSDLAQGYGAVYLPFALERTYPNANRAWAWHYLFPSAHSSVGIVPSRVYTVPSKLPFTNQVFTNMPPATPSVTLSPPICSNPGMIFARFRSCWGIRM